MDIVSILVIESNPLLSKGIIELINRNKNLKVTSSAVEYTKALVSIRRKKPDIILFDSGMNLKNCLEFLQRIKNDSGKIKLIAMNLVSSQEGILLFVQAGVSGFILKTASPSKIIKTIILVAHGAIVLPPILTGTLFSQITENEFPVLKETNTNLINITKRETQIINLITEGFTNKEIEQRLNISICTVKSHIHNILDKLSLHTRLQIVKYTQSYRH